MDKPLMQSLYSGRKPNATFKLNSFGDTESEVRVLTADEMAQMSAEVQTKGLKGLRALYPIITVSLVRPNLHNAELLDVLSEREGRRILNPVDTLRSMLAAGEIGVLLSIYNEHADVTADFRKKMEETKN